MNSVNSNSGVPGPGHDKPAVMIVEMPLELTLVTPTYRADFEAQGVLDFWKMPLHQGCRLARASGDPIPQVKAEGRAKPGLGDTAGSGHPTASPAPHRTSNLVIVQEALRRQRLASIPSARVERRLGPSRIHCRNIPKSRTQSPEITPPRSRKVSNPSRIHSPQMTQALDGYGFLVS